VETHELAQRILARRQNGHSGIDAAESDTEAAGRPENKESAMNVNGNSPARHRVKRHGSPPRALVEKLHADYIQSGCTLDAIASDNPFAKVSVTTVKKWFREAGLPILPRGNNNARRQARAMLAGSTNGHELDAAAVTEPVAEPPFSWHDYITEETAAAPEIEDEETAGEMPEYRELPAEITAGIEERPDDEITTEDVANWPAIDLDSDDKIPDFWRPRAVTTPATSVGAQTVSPALLLALADLAQRAEVHGTIRVQLDFEVTL
jgi:hypothetical protein